MQYETVIGLETHIQLNTQGKAFSSEASAFGAEPNTQTSTISLAHPGTLPRLNQQQLIRAIKLGLALGSEIPLRNEFDRKHYFYTDLPKGFQITQDRKPVCIGGKLPIRLKDGSWKEIRIHHIHMEEDAGKSIHHLDPAYTLIDLNRAGVPLLEVVSEPDLRSADEVDAFMTAMRQLVRFLDISDGNMEEGSLRCDVNISVRPEGSEKYGTRCEVKNLNSMRFARQAIAFERERQIQLLEKGQTIRQQTLNFHPETGETTPLREKEEAHDYRYFPEPDLPPVVLTGEWIRELQDQLPALPWELYHTLRETYQLSDYDAALLTTELEIASFFQTLANQARQPKKAANLMINKVMPYLQAEKMEIRHFPIGTKKLASLIQLVENKQVSQSVANQKLFDLMLEHPDSSPADLAKQFNLLQEKDTGLIAELAAGVVEANPDKVKAYHNGKKGLIGFFMGELMRASKGKADPKAAQQILRKLLEEKK